MKTLRFPSFLDLLGERPYDPPCDGVELRGNQLSRDLDGSAHGLAGVVFADVRGLPRGAPASDQTHSVPGPAVRAHWSSSSSCSMCCTLGRLSLPETYREPRELSGLQNMDQTGPDWIDQATRHCQSQRCESSSSWCTSPMWRPGHGTHQPCKMHLVDVAREIVAIACDVHEARIDHCLRAHVPHMADFPDA